MCVGVWCKDSIIGNWQVAASKDGGSVGRGDGGGRCVQACGEAWVPGIGLAEGAPPGAKLVGERLKVAG